MELVKPQEQAIKSPIVLTQEERAIILRIRSLGKDAAKDVWQYLKYVEFMNH